MKGSERDIAFLADPNQWPMWPLCPVKRYNDERPSSFPELGVVMEAEHGYRLVVGNISTSLIGLPTEAFATAEAIVDAGWVVD